MLINSIWKIYLSKRTMQSSLQGSFHTFLTGPPGVGKTTLIEKVCVCLREKGIPLTGFFTKEQREGNERVGFNIVTLCGKQATLARCSSAIKGPMVGKYTVDVPSFESLVLPLLEEKKDSKYVYIIDEIGKMELFSERFKRKIYKILNEDNNNIIVLGTIPVKRGKGISFVENIRENKNTKVIKVTRDNRNNILYNVTQSVLAYF